MDAERRRILSRVESNIREIELMFSDAEHWNRVHPHEEPIDVDPDGRLRATLAAYREMLEIDAAKGHTGKIVAPSMDLLYPKGPKEPQ